MIAALLLATQVVPPAPPTPPVDWTLLPALPWRTAPRYDPAMARYVAQEVRDGRCPAVRPGATTLTVEVAMLVTGDNRIRAIVPRAIACPTVEQYTSGLLSRMARGNIARADGITDAWYRAAITYAWSE